MVIARGKGVGFHEISWMFLVCPAGHLPVYAEPPNIFLWPLTYLLCSWHCPILPLGILNSKSKAFLNNNSSLGQSFTGSPSVLIPASLCSAECPDSWPLHITFPLAPLASDFWLSLPIGRYGKGTGGKEGISQCVFSLSFYLGCRQQSNTVCISFVVLAVSVSPSLCLVQCPIERFQLWAPVAPPAPVPPALR